MSLALTYARREMRSGFRGFYIFIACLILGVGGIASVQSLSRSLMDSLNADGRVILGADISLRTLYSPPEAAQKKWLHDRYTVTDIIETNTMMRREDGEKSTMIELKAVDRAYPLYGRMEINGDKNLETDGVWLEKEALTRLDAAIGDKVMIGDADFTIKGVIVKEPDRISGTRFSIAPRAMISAAGMAGTGLEGLGSRIDYTTRLKMPDAQAVEDLEKIETDIKTAFPDARWRVRNFYNASPQMERTIERLTLFLTLAGLTTLLIGGVGISNAVKSFLDEKLPHIATLKCLGAGQGFVFRVYMAQIIFIAGLGIAIGLGLSIPLAHYAATMLTDRFSLTATTGFYPEALALAAGFGILVTFCFSLWPLGRAMRVTPADLFRDLVTPAHKAPPRRVILAIIIFAGLLAALTIATSYMPRFAAYFVVGTVAAFTLLFGLSHALQWMLRRLRLPQIAELRLAMMNMTRPGNASTGMIVSLGLGLTVLIGMAGVENNFSRLLKDDISKDAPSFFFIDIQPSQKAPFEKAIAATPGARNLEITPSLRGRIVRVNGVDAEKALIDQSEEWLVRSDRGFTYMKKQPPHGDIVEGAWWPEDYAGPPAISVSMDVQRAFDVGVGDEITVNILGMDITAKIMNVREIEWSSFTMNFAVTFSPGVLEDAPATWLATAIVDEAEEENLQNEIARDFSNVTSVRVKDALTAAQDIIRAVSDAIAASALVTLLAGIMVLSGGIAASRRRHVYDAVILKVLGATRARILFVFLIEYALLGLAAVTLAGGIGSLASYGVMRFILDLPWKFAWGPLFYTSSLCLAVTLVAGFAGTWRVLGQKPSAHLRN